MRYHKCTMKVVTSMHGDGRSQAARRRKGFGDDGTDSLYLPIGGLLCGEIAWTDTGICAFPGVRSTGVSWQQIS
jgi:hypothetical protein